MPIEKFTKSFISNLAVKSGNYALKNQKKFNISFKKNDNNKREIVTDIDRKIEKQIVSAIKKRYPEHNIIGEEFNYEQKKSRYTWVLDPIDGTINYTRNMPHYCTSIALLKDGEPIQAAIYDPCQKHLFYAKKGQGAYLNSRKIKVSKTKKISQAIVEVSESNLSRSAVLIITKLINKVYRVRIEGSTALSLCYVASGWTDCRIKTTVGKYDVAGGVLLVREAGGVATDFLGNRWKLDNHTSIIATNNALKKEFLRIVK